jgi:hypothetical protein
MEAEEIASVVAMLHEAHQQVLLQKGLKSIKSIQIGEEVMISGDVETEMVMVPVSISYDIQAHYEYFEIAPPFDHFNLRGRVDRNGVRPPASQPTQPDPKIPGGPDRPDVPIGPNGPEVPLPENWPNDPGGPGDLTDPKDPKDLLLNTDP